MRKFLWILLVVLASNRVCQSAAILKPTGGNSQLLKPKSLDIAVELRGQFAQTRITTVYANPNASRIEADFEYSAPPGAIVTGFAYWFGNEKVVARVVEKERAAQIYQYIVSKMRDPALIEMIGENRFRARIFPIEANQDLKIEIQLAQTLDSVPNGAQFSWPMREETAQGALAWNFSLRDNRKRALSDNFGMEKSNDTSATILRQSRADFVAPDDLKVLVAQKSPTALQAVLFGARAGGEDGFFALALTAPRDFTKPKLLISGVKTYEVLAQSSGVKAGRVWTVFGRYRGSGGATVTLNGLKTSVVFPNARENGNLATKLWAARKIQILSQNPKNQNAVMALSRRFTIPSKWTSWLAIPAAERARFQQITLVTDRTNATRDYIQAIVRGDTKTAAQQKKRVENLTVQLSKFQDQSVEDDWLGLPQYLNEELVAINRAIESGDPKNAPQVAQWRVWAKNLRRAGAADEVEDEKIAAAEEKIAATKQEKEIQQATLAILREIENGKGEGARAKQLKQRLESLMGGDETEDNAQSLLWNAANKRVNMLAQSLADNQALPRPDAKQGAQLRARLARLEKVVGVETKNEISDAHQRIWGNTIRSLARTAAQEWAANRSNSELAKTSRARLETIKGRTGLDGEWEKEAVLYEIADTTARGLATEIRAGRENQAVAQRLEAQLARFKARGISLDSETTRRAWSGRAYDAAEVWMKSNLENDGATRTQALEAEIERTTKLGRGTVEQYKVAGAIKFYVDYADKLAEEVANGRENSPRAQQMRQKLARILTIAPEAKNIEYSSYARYHSGYYSLPQAQTIPQLAWMGRAHETAYKLEQARQKTPDNATKIADLERELKYVASQAGKEPQEYLEYEKIRLAKNQPLVTAQEYRMRPGDPLISVAAPADCQKIVAILPSGELKTLNFNAQTQHWEARFDIPIYAVEGDYRITIIVVNRDGTRHRLELRFSVDLTPPTGLANARREGLQWNLQVKTDAQTDRVEAILPWGERADLKRGEGDLFTAQIAVPPTNSAKSGVVT